MATTSAARCEQLLERAGRTFAAEAGIALHDTPQPLFQLLVLCTLQAKPIDADLAAGAARALFEAGYRSPSALLAASWQQRVDVLGEGGYRRFDESTATRLAELSEWVEQRWHGDLRELAEAAAGEAEVAAALLTEAPGIGPLGASIFLREVQSVWRWLQPYADPRVLTAAERLRLPHTANGLAAAAGTADLAALTAAIVRVDHDPELLRDP